MKTLCIYHANCMDGFAAAWVVNQAIYAKGNDLCFYPGVYGEAPPDVAGMGVILVDFSYKRDVLLKMAEGASSIRIIDHHESAQEALAGIENEEGDYCPIEVHFDMAKSGALMTWEYYFAPKKVPRLIEHISDRDLWKFELPYTREIVAAVFSYPYDFAVYSELMSMPVMDLVAAGEAIERKHHKDINELLAICRREMFIGGTLVPIASLPYTLSSDAGHIMSKGSSSFAACYWDTPTQRVFSLRSDKEVGMNVQKIAQKYGGGGHANAAGFSVPRIHELARI